MRLPPHYILPPGYEWHYARLGGAWGGFRRFIRRVADGRRALCELDSLAPDDPEDFDAFFNEALKQEEDRLC